MRAALAWAYPIALAVLSLAVALAEALAPARRGQRRWRAHLVSDFAHLVFNGQLVGLVVFALATRWLLPPLDGALARAGLIDHVYRNVAADWPLWLQIVVALVVIDFLQWTVHVMLHRVPALWELHKIHHTVVDGEMDWIVSFRFHWLEFAVYRACLYLPLAFFGFSPVAVLVHAIFGTLIGHLNHANLDLGHGRWRYLLNSPRMHIWHHDYAATGRTTVNFGIIFSAWDWLFGTARMPDAPPARLGFDGAERLPRDFLGQEAWPLSRLLGGRAPLAASALGLVLLGGAWQLGHAGSTPRTRTPMFGERVAASQPAEDHHVYARSADEASAAVDRFGQDARAAGFAHPEDLVSVRELGAALGSPRLRLIDVRSAAAFARGHIPSAQRLYRDDYSVEQPFPGLSRAAHELEAALRARGVGRDSVVVFYGDGGPEPFRAFWTLHAVAGYHARVLDGGLGAWKRDGRGIAEGPPAPIAPGDVVLAASAPPLLWSEIEPIVRRDGALLLDTRSDREFAGTVRHPDAARAGRIPGARNLEWLLLLRDGSEGGDSRLKLPAELRATLAAVGVDGSAPVVSYCQTGTRSSVAWFAMRQVGLPEERLVNYNGSWSEYSRLPQP